MLSRANHVHSKISALSCWHIAKAEHESGSIGLREKFYPIESMGLKKIQSAADRLTCINYLKLK